MILVKNLLSITSTIGIKVKDLKTSPIPRFLADHSLFSMLNEFKLGKSHMGIVEAYVNGRREPIGIVTLEDLIEELLQQEIVDETDEVSRIYFIISMGFNLINLETH